MICKLCGQEMANITHTMTTPIHRIDYGCTNGHVLWITIDKKGAPLSELWRDVHGNELTPPPVAPEA